jgi:hypothetical protein
LQFVCTYSCNYNSFFTATYDAQAAEVEAKQKAAEEDKKKAAAEEQKEKLAAALVLKTASSKQAAKGKASDEQATTGFVTLHWSRLFFLLQSQLTLLLQLHITQT